MVLGSIDWDTRMLLDESHRRNFTKHALGLGFLKSLNILVDVLVEVGYANPSDPNDTVVKSDMHQQNVYFLEGS